MRRLFLWGGAGIALGTLSFLSPGSVFIGFLAAGVALLLYRLSDPPDRRYLLALFLAAFLLRAGVSVGLDALSWKIEGEHPYRNGEVQGWNLHISDKTRGYLKIGDSDYFSQRGYATAQFVEGSNEPVLSFRINQYGKHGYVYCIGLFYYLFGFSPCAVKLINCLLGSGMAVLVFLLGQRCFGTVPAQWAGVLTAVFPSLILWSATNLKDIPLTFFTLLVLFLYSRLTQTRDGRSRLFLLLLLLGSLSVHTTFRSAVLSYLLAGSLLAAHVLVRLYRAHPLRTTVGILVLLATGIGLSFLEPVGYRIRQVLIVPFNWNVGFVTTSGSSYTYLPAQFYEGRYRWEWAETGRMDAVILLGMARAVLHYLFEPFPWKISNTFHLFSYPQSVVWYALFPFVLIGIIQGVRRNPEKTFPLILTAVVFVAAGSLPNGNIGTVFRMRDMVTPLFLILGCAGLHEVARRRSYAQESVLLRQISRFSGWLRRHLENAVRRIARAFWNGPAGQSLRDEPLRSVGLLGIAALITHAAVTSVLGQTITDWIRTVRMALGALALLAVFHQGDWEQVKRNSRLLRFLRQP